MTFFVSTRDAADKGTQEKIYLSTKQKASSSTLSRGLNLDSFSWYFVSRRNPESTTPIAGLEP